MVKAISLICAKTYTASFATDDDQFRKPIILPTACCQLPAD
jgi:hypothetical protein